MSDGELRTKKRNLFLLFQVDSAKRYVFAATKIPVARMPLVLSRNPVKPPTSTNFTVTPTSEAPSGTGEKLSFRKRKAAAIEARKQQQGSREADSKSDADANKPNAKRTKLSVKSNSRDTPAARGEKHAERKNTAKSPPTPQPLSLSARINAIMVGRGGRGKGGMGRGGGRAAGGGAGRIMQTAMPSGGGKRRSHGRGSKAIRGRGER
jgi:hypothetical protein